MAMRNYAKSQVEDGNVEKAKQIMDNMVSIFQAKGLKSAVMTEIKKEAQLPFV